MKTNPLAVIAIGGNSLIKDARYSDILHQWDAVRETAAQIAGMVAAGWRVVITHGNGPQVCYISCPRWMAPPEPGSCVVMANNPVLYTSQPAINRSGSVRCRRLT